VAAIRILHQRYGTGWIFTCPSLPGVAGGGRSFAESADAAEHAVRQYYERWGGGTGGAIPPIVHDDVSEPPG
jgi:hypothetical protein